MGGLTCALALSKRGFKNISVYEYAPNLGFVGAGIQLAPNMARILDDLGVWSEVEKDAVLVEATSVRGESINVRYDSKRAERRYTEGNNNHELGHQGLQTVKSSYGYPHMVGHRSSLASAIYNGCLRASDSIKFHFNTSVEHIKSLGPSPPASFTIKSRTGDGPMQTVEADIILAADGVKSITRGALLNAIGATAGVVDTGQAAYRIMLTREQMASDPELLALLDSNTVVRWTGPRRHLIAYPVSAHKVYNISTAQPDVNFAAAPSATYTTRGSKQAMLDVYGSFCAPVQKMLKMVPEGEVCEWKLRVHSPLPAWVHGSTALMGDACHPTLPHLAQGAAQAIEDAAVLAVVLSYLEDGSGASIERALKTYETLRKERAETLVSMAAASGRALHLGEGKAKEERDRAFQAAKEGKGPMPDKWADPGAQRMIYGHDCVKVAEDLMLGSRIARPSL